MHIQQVRQVRKQVMGSNGQVRTVVELEPNADTTTMVAHGKTYHSEGNGVFHVPDEVGAELVGGIFRDVSDPTGEFTRARIELAHRSTVETADTPRVEEAPPEPPDAPQGVQHAAEPGGAVPNAAAPIPGAQGDAEGAAQPQAPAQQPKSPRGRAAKKASGTRKATAKK